MSAGSIKQDVRVGLRPHVETKIINLFYLCLSIKLMFLGWIMIIATFTYFLHIHIL